MQLPLAAGQHAASAQQSSTRASSETAKFDSTRDDMERRMWQCITGTSLEGMQNWSLASCRLLHQFWEGPGCSLFNAHDVAELLCSLIVLLITDSIKLTALLACLHNCTEDRMQGCIFLNASLYEVRNLLVFPAARDARHPNAHVLPQLWLLALPWFVASSLLSLSALLQKLSEMPDSPPAA